MLVKTVTIKFGKTREDQDRDVPVTDCRVFDYRTIESTELNSSNEVGPSTCTEP